MAGRRCNCCNRLVEITPASRFRTVVYDDGPEGGPEVFMYLAMFECICQNTLSVVLWQDEELAAAEHAEFVAEQAAAAEYERELRPSRRGFFSLTNELAARGL